MSKKEEAPQPKFSQRLRETFHVKDFDGFIAVLRELDQTLTGNIGPMLNEGDQDYQNFRPKIEAFVKRGREGENLQLTIYLGDGGTSRLTLAAEQTQLLLILSPNSTEEVKDKWILVR